jgi:hypothetical protein
VLHFLSHQILKVFLVIFQVDNFAQVGYLGFIAGSELENGSGTATVETFAFQAEVSRLMDIIINSLYNEHLFQIVRKMYKSREVSTLIRGSS